MSFGVMQMSGVLVAQLADQSKVNSYLLGLRLIQAMNQIAVAPFATKLPFLARLFASGRRVELIQVATRGMRLGYWSFVIPFIISGLIGPHLLELINSQTQMPDKPMWIAFGFAIIAERYGAMHIQLYTLTNRVVWHIANGGAGVIMMATWSMLYWKIGLLVFPLGMALANIAFYSWYCSMHSHKEFALPLPGFDASTLMWPLIALTLYSIVWMAAN
jgi:hypothetical protein